VNIATLSLIVPEPHLEKLELLVLSLLQVVLTRVPKIARVTVGGQSCVASVGFVALVAAKKDMPLQGNYNWSDKRDHLIVEIPLKGVSPSKVDILGQPFFPLFSIYSHLSLHSHIFHLESELRALSH
jgi:hypothetical protein